MKNLKFINLIIYGIIILLLIRLFPFLIRFSLLLISGIKLLWVPILIVTFFTGIYLIRKKKNKVLETEIGELKNIRDVTESVKE